MPEGLPEALADAGGLLLIPGLDEIARDPRLLVDAQLPVRPGGRGLSLPADQPERGAPGGAGDLHGHQHGAELPPAAETARSAAHGRRRAFRCSIPQRNGWHTDQSYRRPPPDISLFFAVTPVARERGQTLFASGTLAYDALPADSQGQGRDPAGPACPAGHRPWPRRRRGRQDAARLRAARTLAAAAGRAHPSGHRPEGALSLRARPDGLVRRAVRRHGARSARRRRPAARRAHDPLHAAGVHLRPRMDPGRRAGVGQSLPDPYRDLVRRREGTAHDVAHHGARQSGRRSMPARSGAGCRKSR